MDQLDTIMTTDPTIQYSKRRPRGTGTDQLKVTLEAPLANALRTAQDTPGLIIKGSRKPSRSLICRRALTMYTAYLSRLTPEQLQRESGELHKLA